MWENPINGVCRKRGSSQRFSLEYVDLGEKYISCKLFSLSLCQITGVIVAVVSVGLWGFFV